MQILRSLCGLCVEKGVAQCVDSIFLSSYRLTAQRKGWGRSLVSFTQQSLIESVSLDESSNTKQLVESITSSSMHKLKQEQFLPITLDEAWAFFATPANLNLVTPPELVFEITSALPEEMYEGLIITYRIKPMLNIPIDWCTEITHIKDKQFFVDEQRKGPYNIWHHEHHFKPVDRGVIMTDILHYDIGKWVVGWAVGKLFVHRKIAAIFDFRYKALERHFRKSNTMLRA